MKMLKRRDHERGEELARRVQAAGIPIVEAKKDEVPELLIRQDFEAYESMVFDSNGGAGLILPLRITANVGVFLSGVDIALDGWPNALFWPLEENWRGEWPHYEFYRQAAFKFHRSKVINQALAEQKELRCGHLCHGLLLAFSHEPMPDEFTYGATQRGSVGIYDQFERKHSEKISLRIHRQFELLPQPNPRRRSLFTRPDFRSPL